MNGPGSRVRVAVIGGGRSSEHDVGLASAAAVRDGLDPARYTAVPFTIDLDGTWLDADGRRLGGVPVALERLTGCDVAFPAVHGPYGEDGCLAALFEVAGVPYVGSGVAAGALGMDKRATKLVAAAAGLAVARADVVRSPADPVTVPLPVVVKPVVGGSSHGVTRVDDPALLADAVAAALRLDDRALVEQLVPGREVDVGVLVRPGGDLLVAPPLEVLREDGRLFDARQKYDGSARFALPAELTDGERKDLVAGAVAMVEEVGCAGVARVDFFLTPEGRPVLNEINTMPGLTPRSQVPRMFAAAGLPYPRLMDELVRAALARA